MKTNTRKAPATLRTLMKLYPEEVKMFTDAGFSITRLAKTQFISWTPSRQLSALQGMIGKT